MATTTISNTVTNTVTLDGTSYGSPLTITATGTVAPGAGAIGIFEPGIYVNGVVINQGQVRGGRGAHGTGLGGAGGKGGTGIEFDGGGTIVNSGGISGGAGGIGVDSINTPGGLGGMGGNGIELDNGGIVVNNGGISGGAGAGGGYGGSSAGATGGGGGAGINLSGAASITNTATIAGGSGGAGGVGRFGGGAADGGAGITASDTVGISNASTGVIVGGAGGFGGGGPGGFPSLVYPGEGGHGGAGISVAAGSLGNAGTITGGQGGHGGTGSIVRAGAPGGAGGAGVRITGTLDNSGTITGGSGGAGAGGYDIGGSGGDGGAGVSLSGTLDNSGTIIGGAGGTGGLSGSLGGRGGAGGAGVSLSGAGTIANTGTIAGGAGGAGFGTGSAGTVGAGIVLTSGGQVTNGTASGNTALITGGIGVSASAAAATVINYGTIAGNSGAGVVLGAGGTIIDAGTVAGAGSAIVFGGAGGNLLVLENGYALGGTVLVAGTANTLELLGATGTIGVDFDKAGAGFTNFATVLFGMPGGNGETLTISDTTSLPGTIASFVAYRDIIDLTPLNPAGLQTPVLNGQDLVVSNGSQSVTLHLDSENYGGVIWQATPDGHGGTDVSVACYCRGTMVLTEAGEVPVEELRIGDLLVTLSGALRPIHWIGRRDYDGRFIAGNRDALPICIKPDAIMHGVPARELWVSPEHSLYIDDILVQAKHLTNGRTVVQPENVAQVEYFHIELESHDVIYADGMPAETFVDCDNRRMFANGAEYDARYPDDGGRPRWQFCAPRLEWGAPALVAIRAWMFDRARQLGYTDDNDPALHLVVDGATQLPIQVTGSAYRFDLPAGCREISIGSYCFSAAEHEAESCDTRRLGIPLERLVLFDSDLSIEAWHGHASLGEGFHADEATHRWTNGLARISDALLRPFAAGFTLDVHLAAATFARRESA